MRDLKSAAPLVDEVFADAGIAIAHEIWIELTRTSLGRSLLALLRCALLGGGPADLLVWLRSPSGPGGSGRRVDGLEADVREHGLTELDAALASWARLGGHELRAIARLREAADAGRAGCTRRSRARPRGCSPSRTVPVERAALRCWAVPSAQTPQPWGRSRVRSTSCAT